MSNLSTSVFRSAKFVFNAKLEESICAILLISVSVAWFEISALTLISPPNGSYGLGKYWLVFYTIESR